MNGAKQKSKAKEWLMMPVADLDSSNIQTNLALSLSRLNNSLGVGKSIGHGCALYGTQRRATVKNGAKCPVSETSRESTAK